MTAELHAHASLTVEGVADMLEHGRDHEATDELRIAAVKRHGSRVRLTAEILRLPKHDDDDGLAVEFMADVDRDTLVRLGRLFLALASECTSPRHESSPMVALPFGDAMRAADIGEIDLDTRSSGATLTVRRASCGSPTTYEFDDKHEAEAEAHRIRDMVNRAAVAGGCAACPHATMRFNGGNGATTCELLSEKIVAYGTCKPSIAPSECPRITVTR